MFIPREQLENENFPIAFKLTIRIIPEKPANEKSCLEHLPDFRQRKLIKKTITESLCDLGIQLQVLQVSKKKIELVVEAKVEIEKIVGSITLLVIEVLRESGNFSEKINPWQPQKKIESLWTRQSVRKAINEIEGETEKGLEIGA